MTNTETAVVSEAPPSHLSVAETAWEGLVTGSGSTSSSN